MCVFARKSMENGLFVSFVWWSTTALYCRSESDQFTSMLTVNFSMPKRKTCTLMPRQKKMRLTISVGLQNKTEGRRREREKKLRIYKKPIHFHQCLIIPQPLHSGCSVSIFVKIGFFSPSFVSSFSLDDDIFSVIFRFSHFCINAVIFVEIKQTTGKWKVNSLFALFTSCHRI